MKAQNLPDSPCLGYCTTALGDDVCKSCGRTFEEVNSWITMSKEEKDAVWHRLVIDVRKDGWQDQVDKMQATSSMS